MGVGNVKTQKNTLQANVFISYSRQNRDFAKDLYRRLDAEGFQLWRDVHDIEAGADDWWEAIKQGIEQCDTLILCMSMPALKSPVVSDEWFYARQLGKRVIPVVADDIWGHPEVVSGEFTIPNWMNRRNWIDYRDRQPEADIAWQNLIDTLQRPYEPKRFINMVGELPPRFVRRPQPIDRAIRSLVDVHNDAIAMTTALIGAGGYGKTTLVKAIARDVRVQGAFDDGILWVTLGEELLKKQGEVLRNALIGMVQELIHALTGERTVIDTLDMANTKLKEAIGDLYILLVIDDVWNEAHLKPFLVNGSYSACLITTRNADTVTQVDIIKHEVDKMLPVEAVELLSAGFAPEDVAPLKAEFTAFARDLRDYPLLLALANTTIINWKDDLNIPLSEALQLAHETFVEQGILGFDDRDTQDRTRAVDLTLAVSLNQLQTEEKRRYLELAIFREDALIPLTTLERYWGMSKVQTLQFCTRLYRRTALLHSFEGMAVRIHDIFRDYLIRQHTPEGRRTLHTRLIDRYGNLTALPDDYAWHHLAHHLIEAGRRETLRDLLLNADFLQGKLNATRDAYSLQSDCIACGLHDDPIHLIYSALRLSNHILSVDPAQGLSQLYGRLLSHRDNQPDLFALLDYIAEYETHPALLTVRPSLQQAGGSLSYTLTGHTGAVTAVAFAPDGKSALSSSDDGTLKLWDMVTGQEIRTFKIFIGGMKAVAFSPDGKTALSASGIGVTLWEVATGQEIRGFFGHEKDVLSIAFAPDGQTFLSASWDTTLRLWDVTTGQEIRTFTGHTLKVNAVTFAPDGKTALSASDDHTLKLWDITTGQEIRTFTGHAGGGKAATFAPDGRTVLFASWDKKLGHSLKLCDVTTGQEIRTFTGHENSVNAVAFAPDGQTFLSASWDKTLKLWDVTTEQEIRTFTGHTHWVSAVAFAPHGESALSGSHDWTLRVWDVAIGQEHHILTGHGDLVRRVAFAPDGQIVLSASDDWTLKLWDVTTGREIHAFTEYTGRVKAATFAPDGRTVLFASWDNTLGNTLKLCDVTTGQEIHTFTGHEKTVTAVAFAPDGRTALSASDDGEIKLWDVTTGQEIRTFTGHGWRVYAVAFAPDGKTALSASDDHTLKLWEVASGQMLRVFSGPASMVAVAFAPDGKTALSADWDIMLMLWEVATGDLLRDLSDTPSNRATLFARYGITLDPVLHEYGLLLARQGSALTLWQDGQRLFGFGGDTWIEGCDIAQSLYLAFGDAGGAVHILRPNKTIKKLMNG